VGEQRSVDRTWFGVPRQPAHRGAMARRHHVASGHAAAGRRCGADRGARPDGAGRRPGDSTWPSSAASARCRAAFETGSGEREPTKVAIIGSGNIGTDLMIKVLRLSERARDGGDGRDRPGLRRPGPRVRMGVATTHEGSTACSPCPSSPSRDRVRCDQAGAHKRNSAWCWPHGKRMIDLTPAAIGPYVRAGGQPGDTSMRPTSTW
jgi:hypothetical protein